MEEAFIFSLFNKKTIFLFAFCITSISSLASANSSQIDDPLKSLLGQQNLGQQSLGSWKDGILSATAAGPSSDGAVSTLILGANRTERPDILSGFHKYRGGWNITDKHYWASVGFTGAAGFILAVVWLISFGLALVVHHCCGWSIPIKGKDSPRSLRVCLILLILFTCAAAIGCILLSVGQDKFHDEALNTLKYVVNQSDYTVQTLRNVTQYMSLARNVSVAQIFLPADAISDIDRLNVDLNTAADTLKQKTYESSGQIRRVFNLVRLALITVAAVMLLVSVLGLVLSILGHQHAIYIFIISGWLLVAVTFIICGLFVVLDNAISDTCLAMGEWVDNPQAETALSKILPCVDERTTNQTLLKSKQVIVDIVNVANGFIYTFANANPPPEARPYYYNQSGPVLLPLCYPYDSQLQDRQCTDYEVSVANASTVWQNYTCTVSASGICNSVGRLTPDMYGQLVAAVNISYALEHYTPPLLNLQNCNFVRNAFRNITSNHCPPLEHYLHIVNGGLAMIAVGVMLCLALWTIYANRPQREEVFARIGSRIKAGCNGNNNSNTNEVSPNGTTSNNRV